MGTGEIILGVISTIAIALGTNFIKELFNFKKYKVEISKSEKRQDEKSEEREKKLQEQLFERIEGMEKIMVNEQIKNDEMHAMLKAHIEENEFREKFKDAIKDSSRQVMMLTQDFLDQDYKNMLAHWTDSMKKLGLDYYYSNVREGNKKQREKWANSELNVHVGNFFNFVDYHKSSIRLFHRKKVNFSDFLRESGLHGKTEILKLDLVRNGFKNYQDIIDRFTEYIDDFINDFISSVMIWNKQELVVDKQISA